MGCPRSPPSRCQRPAVVKPELLQKAAVELLDQGLCAGLYGPALTDRMLCAGYLDGKVDSCQVRPWPGTPLLQTQQEPSLGLPLGDSHPLLGRRWHDVMGCGCRPVWVGGTATALLCP